MDKLFLRTFLEEFTRNWVFRRRLSSRFGSVPLYVSPSAGLRYLFRPLAAADPALLSLISDYVKSGDVVWDIGANVGLFSFAAAHSCGPQGRVIACEPDPWLVQLLRRSAAIQSKASAPVVVIQVGIAGDIGVRRFCFAKRSRSANFLAEYGTTQTGGVRDEQTIVTVTLNWLSNFYPPPAVIKIDVEGAEIEVVKAADRVLEIARPIVFCEVGAESANEVTAFLHSKRYKIYDGEAPAPERRPLSQACWSTVAIPG